MQKLDEDAGQDAQHQGAANGAAPAAVDGEDASDASAEGQKQQPPPPPPAQLAQTSITLGAKATQQAVVPTAPRRPGESEGEAAGSKTAPIFGASEGNQRAAGLEKQNPQGGAGGAGGLDATNPADGSIPPPLRNSRPGTTKSTGERLLVNGELFSKRRCLCERVDLLSLKGETPWCRLAEELLGEERHECFDWMVTLPAKGSPGEIRHGVNIRERWLQHLGLTEAMIDGVKDKRIRWTHFPKKCWEAAVKARQELMESTQKRVASLNAHAAVAQRTADALPDTAASTSEKAAAHAEVKRLHAEAERVQEEAEKPKRTLRRLTWYVDRDENDSPEDFIMYRRRRDRGELAPKALAMPNVKWAKLKKQLQKPAPSAAEILDGLLGRTRALIAKVTGQGAHAAAGAITADTVTKRLFGVVAADLHALVHLPRGDARAALPEVERLALAEKENEVLRRALSSSRVTFENLLQEQSTRADAAESRLAKEKARNVSTTAQGQAARAPAQATVPGEMAVGAAQEGAGGVADQGAALPETDVPGPDDRAPKRPRRGSQQRE